MNNSTGADEPFKQKQDFDQVSYESKDHNKNEFVIKNDPYKDENPNEF
jgi:hypothetical protein